MNIKLLYCLSLFICLIFLGQEKKNIFFLFVKIILQFGIGLFGPSLPLKFSNQATFSGELINIFSILLDLISFITLFILEFILSPVTFLSKP